MSNHSTTLRYWLDRHNAGDPAAMNELLRFSQDRVLEHIRARFQPSDRLRRFADSQDVLVDVQANLAEHFRTAPFNDLMHFLRLTGRLARNRMIDLVRRYFGPQGPGTREMAVDPNAETGPNGPGAGWAPDPAPSPEERALRAEVDQVIADLPPEHRDLFDLLYSARLPRAEAAEILGLAPRTLDRRWLEAREALRERFGNDPPV